MILNKLLAPCRLVSATNVLLRKRINPKYFVTRELHVTAVQTMAQRSITSFFKATPPKNTAVKDDKKQIETAEVTKKEEKSPVVNGVGKVMLVLIYRVKKLRCTMHDKLVYS